MTVPTSSSYARYSITNPSLPAGTDHVVFYVYVIGIGESSQVDLRLDEALIERSASAGAYFDGGSASCAWDGAAHASTSTLLSGEEVSCGTTQRDSAGRITDVGVSLQGAAALTSHYDYSANNRLTRQSGSGFDPQATNQVYFYQAMTGWLTRRNIDDKPVSCLDVGERSPRTPIDPASPPSRRLPAKSRPSTQRRAEKAIHLQPGAAQPAAPRARGAPG